MNGSAAPGVNDCDDAREESDKERNVGAKRKGRKENGGLHGGPMDEVKGRPRLWMRFTA